MAWNKKISRVQKRGSSKIWKSKSKSPITTKKCNDIKRQIHTMPSNIIKEKSKEWIQHRRCKQTQTRRELVNNGFEYVGHYTKE